MLKMENAFIANDIHNTAWIHQNTPNKTANSKSISKQTLLKTENSLRPTPNHSDIAQ